MKYEVHPRVAEILAHPQSTKEQAYELGYNAGRLAGILETHQQFDKMFRERFTEKRV